MLKFLNFFKSKPNQGPTLAINHKPKKGPWGGGNQFVELLTDYLRQQGVEVVFKLTAKVQSVLIIDPRELNTTAFNINQIQQFKTQYPATRIIHRINECDERKKSKFIDDLLLKTNQIADHTVFISEWLKNYFLARGYHSNQIFSVIPNAADDKIFFPENNSIKELNHGRLKLVTHHWSDNWMKGFKVYQQLDQLIAQQAIKNIEFTVIGRWPPEIKWQATHTLGALKGQRLANKLREHDCYITASLFEPCGMHHIEGAQCGLPLLYHQDGGGIVEFGQRYGIEFNENTLIAAIETARKNFVELHQKVLKHAPQGKVMAETYRKILF